MNVRMELDNFTGITHHPVPFVFSQYPPHDWGVFDLGGLVLAKPFIGFAWTNIPIPEPYQGPRWEHGDPWPSHRRDIDCAYERPVR